MRIAYLREELDHLDDLLAWNRLLPTFHDDTLNPSYWRHCATIERMKGSAHALECDEQADALDCGLTFYGATSREELP